MGRVIGLLLAISGIVAFTLLYKQAPLAYTQGFYWPLTPAGFPFWFTAGLIGLLAAHQGGEGRWLAPLVAIGVGAVFVLLASRGTQIPELARTHAPIILLLGMLIAYGAKPELWLTLGAAGVGAAAQGFYAGRAVGARLDELWFLGGFGASLAVFLIGGLVLGDLAAKAGGGGLRARIGAGAAGLGLYLTLQPLVSWM